MERTLASLYGYSMYASCESNLSARLEWRDAGGSFFPRRYFVA